MIGCSSIIFSSYIPTLGNHHVLKIADGSCIDVVGTGTYYTIHISQDITLKAILHVPNLSCNFLSISKITQDINCDVIFSSSCCIF